MARAQVAWLLQSTADHPGLGRGLAPRALLSAQEMAVYQTLNHEKRRRDWLLGRWTAKHLLQDTGGGPAALDRLAVLAAADGAPEAWLEDDGKLRLLPRALSISHAHGVSFCATLEGSDSLGADIEQITTRPASFAAAYFSAPELALLEAAPTAERDLLSTAIWSAKEGALKALRMGLRLDTRTISCALAPIPTTAATWQAFPIIWRPTGGAAAVTLQGWWRVWQGFVLALAVMGTSKTPVNSSPTRQTASRWGIQAINEAAQAV